MVICHKCGIAIGDLNNTYPYHQCPTNIGMHNVPIIYKQTPDCAHCYCREDWTMNDDYKKIPHKRCCNCGNKQVILVGQ